MKDWYAKAWLELVNKLKDEKKIDGQNFLQDFILDNRDEHFEDVELDDVDDFTTEEFKDFLSWLHAEKNQQLKISPSGKWSLNGDSGPCQQINVIKPQRLLTVEEEELINFQVFNLSGGLVDSLKLLHSKLASTNFHDIKFKCAFRLAVCAELNKDFREKDLIEFWKTASEMAEKAKMSREASECLRKAAHYSVRMSEHREAAGYFEKAFNLSNELSFSDKIQLLRDSRAQFQISGDHDSASRIFRKEKEIEYKESDTTKKIAMLFYRFTSNYGESPIFVIFNICLVLILSTLASFFIGITASKGIVKYSWEAFFNSAYFSVVTFTTLGYGDFSPTNFSGKILACIVAFSGLVYTSLLMVTIVRKYSRS